MNSGFYNDLDTNFKEALEMSKRDFLHDELINMLINGNIPQKQIAALRLDCLNSKQEADILIGNLTGCDGKIREAVALTINNLLNQNKDYALYFYHKPEIFANATIDINGNICRLVIDSVSILKNNKGFTTTYLKYITKFISEAFDELNNFNFRDKKYTINKQLFKLYWCLETLKLFVNIIDINVLYSIIERASKEREYTIREKTAQLIKISNNKIFDSIKKELMNDDNYYVKNIFK